MTLADMKKRTYSLIEEYSASETSLTEDEDYATKFNSCCNMIQDELCRFKKINASDTMEVEEDQEIDLSDIDSRIYQLNLIRGVEAEIIGNTITFKEEGTAKIYYYKFPKQIDMDTTDDYKFELDTDVLEIMPYGIAGLLLSSDPSNSYGQLFTNLYTQKLTQLDSRKSMQSITITGGLDV